MKTGLDSFLMANFKDFTLLLFSSKAHCKYSVVNCELEITSNGNITGLS